ncbi:MAG: hypothetical protein KatS3mg052_1252 [Candidatus Roseilinea sp.]|nr:MAG: hypothetical protein KatS3mg052_1252 [Candidatus Roseilinea sp.]
MISANSKAGSCAQARDIRAARVARPKAEARRAAGATAWLDRMAFKNAPQPLRAMARLLCRDEAHQFYCGATVISSSKRLVMLLRFLPASSKL